MTRSIHDSQHPHRGFTLIEILVSLVILLILAGLLYPAFGGAQQKKWKMECLANLKCLHQGLAIQLTEDPNIPRITTTFTDDFLRDYIGQSRAQLRCPIAPEGDLGYRINPEIIDGTGQLINGIDTPTQFALVYDSISDASTTISFRHGDFTQLVTLFGELLTLPDEGDSNPATHANFDVP